ncbi:hypothetical protein E1301_Tti019759 [Triplophysa tibetana]|uniref:Uncharacterized protein n=1 Tax=Triplophysa tibetana TaxID=1572043 RepID=A0A5A9PJH8_9TELE|nr:hypothetical protein E1301_Tti019759 [Triplophysa tibetana]
MDKSRASYFMAAEQQLLMEFYEETSQTVKRLNAKHLERQIEMADVKITLKKRKLQEMELDLEIKHRTLQKLVLEIQKLQREDPNNPDK